MYTQRELKWIDDILPADDAEPGETDLDDGDIKIQIQVRACLCLLSSQIIMSNVRKCVCLRC